MATKTSSTKAPSTAPATNPVKKGQAAKTTAQVIRPNIPTGFVGNTTGTTPAQQGIKPSAGYPQGSATIKLLALPATAGKNQQANYSAVHGALGGVTGTLAHALAHGATRRQVRRLVRAGLLAWQAPSN
jgi:hypothetical protein